VNCIPLLRLQANALQTIAASGGMVPEDIKDVTVVVNVRTEASEERSRGSMWTGVEEWWEERRRRFLVCTSESDVFRTANRRGCWGWLMRRFSTRAVASVPFAPVMRTVPWETMFAWALEKYRALGI